VAETNGRPIDQIRAAFRRAKRSLAMPELGGLVFWFGPVTPADMQAVEDRKPKDHHDRNLILLIHKAESETGKPLFQMGDLHYLKTECDYVVLQKVVNFMFDTITDEEAKTAVETDPTSASVSA
jgi:hypothetical protein